MRAVRIRGLFLATSLIPISGCGTMANLQGKSRPMLSQVHVENPRPFGGVGRDIRWISSIEHPANLLFVADLPLSFVSDIITLPRTLGSKPAPVAPPRALDRSQSEPGKESRTDVSCANPGR